MICDESSGWLSTLNSFTKPVLLKKLAGWLKFGQTNCCVNLFAVAAKGALFQAGATKTTDTQTSISSYVILGFLLFP